VFACGEGTSKVNCNLCMLWEQQCTRPGLSNVVGLLFLRVATVVVLGSREESLMKSLRKSMVNLEW
jgi:hypothetical protein